MARETLPAEPAAGMMKSVPAAKRISNTPVDPGVAVAAVSAAAGETFVTEDNPDNDEVEDIEGEDLALMCEGLEGEDLDNALTTLAHRKMRSARKDMSVVFKEWTSFLRMAISHAQKCHKAYTKAKEVQRAASQLGDLLQGPGVVKDEELYTKA